MRQGRKSGFRGRYRGTVTAALVLAAMLWLAACGGSASPLTKTQPPPPPPSTTHTVVLNWTASASSPVGYNVYRSQTSGGPYTKLTAAPLGATTYTDAQVEASQTYYYVTTAVDGQGVESAYSNQVTVSIPAS